MAMKIITRAAVRRLRNLFLLIAGVLAVCYFVMIRMPGKSFRGPLPPATAQQQALADELRRDLQILAGDIGERNAFLPGKLEAAATFIETQLAQAGYQVQRHPFPVHLELGPNPESDTVCSNLSVEIPGATKPEEIIIVGAHYDSIFGSPGANDNGTGVVATLALARRMANSAPRRTLRFVFFVNEEPPFFQQEGQMGSLVYARQCRDNGDNIIAMLALETMGCFSDEPGTQHYPLGLGLLYPTTGNFIGFVGGVGSRHLVRKCIAAFRQHAQFPSEGAALPGGIPGVGWSDHWSFWQAGYDAIMVTDTAPFRYGDYHEASDTPDKVDYDRLARVTEGVQRVIEDLASE
ncbi:MAG: M28 family peptidase [Phycisphaerales bacterium]|nr:M28 family peptidase [Phycisphaerales bacterium]